MSNSFIMTESIVRPAKMPYGRLKDNGFVGIEGEHAARALVVETKDDLSAFASVNLIIDDLDCGAMTKTTSGSTTTLSMTLTSSMIGRSGRKICQLIMVNSGNTVVQKSSQFEAYVGRANEIERSVDDGVTIIILSEAVTEMAREAAAAAAEEAVADVVEDCQAIADAASASADAAAQSASDAQTAAASITVDATLDPTSTHAIQNKAVASEISSIKADLEENVDVLKSAITQNITFADASYIKHEDGTVGSNHVWTKASGFIAIIPGNTFNLSGYVGSETISSRIGLAFYDKNKIYVSGVQYDGNNISVVVPQTAMFVRFTVYTSCISSYIVNGGSILPTHDFTLLSDFPFSITEKQIGLTNLGAMPKHSQIIDNITFENGKYIMSNGNVGSVSYASLSEYIDATDIETVYASLSNVIPVSYFDENKQWISNFYGETVQSRAEAVPKEYSVTIPVNARYIRISNIHTSLSDASVYVGIGYGYMKNTQQTSVAAVSGKYVAVVNSGNESSVSFAEVTDFIEVSGITSYRTSLSNILSACYYDAEKNYISGVTGENGESPSWRNIDAPENAMYIRISNDTRYNTFGVSVKVEIPKKIQNVAYKADINYLQGQIYDADTSRNILSMYDDIICIGDSLTWSQVYYSNNGQRQAYKTYPRVLGSLCGAESHQYATPGDTAILWWQRSSEGAFSNHGLYIVFLGTNAGFTDTISTDCVGTDPANFANTNTGQYGRILQTITNNGDKAVLVMPYGGGGGTAELLAVTRDVINQFGTKYNFPVINLDNPARTNAYYHYFPDKSGQNTLHFNDLGYTWVANEIFQQINKLSIADQWNIRRTQ